MNYLWSLLLSGFIELVIITISKLPTAATNYSIAAALCCFEKTV